MRLAFLSGIYGNYEALNAVLLDIEAQRVDQIYCLGDLVGYGPYPNAVVELIRSLDIATCQGCWDEAIAEEVPLGSPSYGSLLAERRGATVYDWTRRDVYPEVREYLADLPRLIQRNQILGFHGKPAQAGEEGGVVLRWEQAVLTGAERVFCSHGGARAGVQVIRVGPVGEARGGRPLACYSLYDTESQRVNERELEYDYVKTCQAMLEKGLPRILAWRLAQGLPFGERLD